jgi:predicted MFS family arabinose efflux permease
VNVDDLGERPPSFRALFSIRPFSVLFGAEIQSLIGDQLARVALSTLVFERTGNAAATALTYAATYLPAIFGGFVLAGVGDRLPRLGVMIGCDVLRAVLFLIMGISGVPLGVMIGLLVVAVLFEPAFSAAQFAYLAATLSADDMASATGVRMSAMQAAQVAGFAVGGVIVAAVSPRGALLVDAATFAVSALAVSAVVRMRAPASSPSRAAAAEATLVQVEDRKRNAATWLWRDRPILLLVALISLVGLFVVPEGLAVPYAHAIGHSTAVAGLLLASMPLGGAVGALVIVRFVSSQRRPRIASMMVVMCGVPLIATALQPPWPVAFVAWFVSGVFAGYQVELISELGRRVPDDRRSGVMGVAGGCLTAAQGLAISAFGGLGELITPGIAIAAAGVVGIVAAAVTVRARSAVDQLPGRHRQVTLTIDQDRHSAGAESLPRDDLPARLNLQRE